MTNQISVTNQILVTNQIPKTENFVIHHPPPPKMKGGLHCIRGDVFNYVLHGPVLFQWSSFTKSRYCLRSGRGYIRLHTYGVCRLQTPPDTGRDPLLFSSLLVASILFRIHHFRPRPFRRRSRRPQGRPFYTTSAIPP